MRYSNEPSGLKRSLAAARAEIERLKDQVEMQRKLFAESALLAVEWERKAEKAEAERDEALAQVAAAFEYAAKLCDDTAQEALDESGTCSRILWTWFCGQSSAIRALTPADAKTALEAYGREREREGMRMAADKIMDRINNTDFAMNYHAPLTLFCKSILAGMETLK